MRIDISEMISTSNKSVVYEITPEKDRYVFDGSSCPVRCESPVRVIIANAGERKAQLEVCGDLSVDIPCGRCLTPVPTAFHIEALHLIDLSKEADEDGSDRSVYMPDGQTVDTEQLIYYELYTRFPMKTLCRPDCKGICPKCGKDLNEGECGCDRDVPDPRMAAIRDIFKNFKEV